MIVWCGFTRETEVERDVVDHGNGAGEIDCLECDGSGKWPFVDLSIDMPEQDCVPCKGTGRVLVSV
jgi:hypothetical protein